MSEVFEASAPAVEGGESQPAMEITFAPQSDPLAISLEPLLGSVGVSFGDKPLKIHHSGTVVTESPSSITFSAKIEGYPALFTLRDSETAALIARVQVAISWMREHRWEPDFKGRYDPKPASAPPLVPAPAMVVASTPVTMPQAIPAVVPPPVPVAAVPMCPSHNTPMRLHKSGTAYFCPRKVADNDGTGKPAYCKYTVKVGA